MSERAALPIALIELMETLPDGVIVASLDGRILGANSQMCELSGYTAHQLIDAPIETLVPTRLRAEHVARRAAYAAGGSGSRPMSQRLDIVLRRADGQELPVDIALSTMKHDDEPVVIAAVRDATLRREAELLVERERAFFTALNDVSAALLAGGEVRDTLRRVVAAARSMVDADLTLVTVVEGDDLVALVGDGDLFDIDAMRMRLADSASSSVLEESEPVLVLDAATDPRSALPTGIAASFGPVLLVPLHARGQSMGILTIARHRGRDVFAASEVTLMRSFASHAAIALADADAQEQARRLRVLEDRERVAAEVSEKVIHRISSAALTLHTLVSSSPDEQRVWEAIDDLDAAIAAIRSAIFPS